VKKGSKATLDWLRNKGKDDDKTDPTGEFRKLDQLMPQKRGQTWTHSRADAGTHPRPDPRTDPWTNARTNTGTDPCAGNSVPGCRECHSSAFYSGARGNSRSN
jgi:hypothetical protein